MSVPKKRRTPSSVRQRRSHHALKPLILAKCSKCGKAIETHAACGFCGNFKGKEVLTVKVKTKKETK